MLDPKYFETSDEYGTMSGIDEYMVHNNPLPIRAMWTSDPRAFERMWFGMFDKTGDLMIIMGIGFYPNLNTADAYAIVNYRGQHTTVRGQRMLGTNRMDLSVGPLKFEVVKPFEQWRLSLAENDYGISFEIDWFDGNKRPEFADRGDVSINLATYRPGSGYESFGQQQGWVKINGETHQLTRGEFQGSRDHHWGVRDNVGGPSFYPGPISRHIHTGEFVEFKDFALFSKSIFYNQGDPRRTSDVREAHRKVRFDPVTKLLLGGEADVTFTSGEHKKYTFERVGNQIGFLRCGMYGGFGGNSGTPEEDIWHGRFSGDLTITGETYDANDPDVQVKIAGFDDCVARFECEGEVTYGFTETVHPGVYQAAVDGRNGLSLLEE